MFKNSMFGYSRRSVFFALGFLISAAFFNSVENVFANGVPTNSTVTTSSSGTETGTLRWAFSNLSDHGGTVAFGLTDGSNTITLSNPLSTLNQNYVDNLINTSGTAVTVNLGTDSMTVTAGTLNIGANQTWTSSGSSGVVYSSGALTIGTSTACISGSVSSGDSYGIFAQGALTATNIGGTVSAASNGIAAAISGSSGVHIDDLSASVRVTGGTCYGIYSESGNITIQNNCGGTISAVGSYGGSGIDAENGGVTIGTLSSVVNASSEISSGSSYGIYANNDLSIGVFSSSGSIATSAGVENAFGIRSMGGSVTILGDCAGAISTRAESDSMGISGHDVGIGGVFSGVITTSSTHSGDSTGINADNDVWIDSISGSISASASDSTDSHAFGIHSLDGNITIHGNCGGVIAANGYTACGINADGNVTIGTLSGIIRSVSDANPDTVAASGIYVGSGNVSINTLSGSISANAPQGMVVGIYAHDGRVDIANLTGTISCSGAALACAILGQNVNLNVSDTATISATATSGAAYAIKTILNTNSTITLHSGCKIIGDIDLGGDSETVTLAAGSGSTTLNGTISNVENLLVTGGYWNLMGTITGVNNFNFTGGTFALNGSMDVGTVSVGSGATLGGTGTIGELINFGTVAPGNSIGTLHVTGNYLNKGDVNIQIDDAGNCDKIAVGGTASIQSGTVNVQAASGSYHSGATYKFLTASAVDGTFSGVTDDLAFFDASLIYGSDYVEILLTANGSNYDSQAATPNQHAVAQTLDRTSSGATGDYGTVLSSLNTLNGPGARQAFDALGGELFGSIATVGIENNDQMLRAIAGRLQSQSLSASGDDFARRDNLEDNLRYCSLRDSADALATGWTTWAQGYGVGSNLASDGNASGLKYSTGGLLVGVERLFGETTIGLVGGYSSTNLTLDDRGDNGSIDGGQAAVYLHRNFEQAYFTSVAGYGYNSYATTRYIDFAAIDRTAHANYGGNNFSFYDEIGRTIYGRSVNVQPYAGLEYIQLHQNDFAETGADSIDIAAGGQRANAFRSMLGTRVYSDIHTDAGRVVTLEGRAAWRHEFLDENRVLDASFDGVTGSAFTIAGDNVDRDAAITGVGLTYHIRTGFAIFANYDAVVSQNYTAHTGAGGVEYQW